MDCGLVEVSRIKVRVRIRFRVMVSVRSVSVGYYGAV